LSLYTWDMESIPNSSSAGNKNLIFFIWLILIYRIGSRRSEVGGQKSRY
jgi:hypothetical protein